MAKNKLTQYNSIWTRDAKGRFSGRRLTSEYGSLGRLGLVKSQFGNKLLKLQLSIVTGIAPKR